MKVKKLFEDVSKEEIQKKIEILKTSNTLLIYMKSRTYDKDKKKEYDEYRERNKKKIEELEKQLNTLKQIEVTK